MLFRLHENKLEGIERKCQCMLYMFEFTLIMEGCGIDEQLNMSEYYIFVKYICIFLKCSLNPSENVSKNVCRVF